MVRIGLPNRLKSSYGANGANSVSQPGSRSASPMRQAGQCLVLRTTVLKGRNLAAKDKSGTSDPYLVVNLGDTKQSTPTVSKTLNPEWNVTFDLPIVGIQCLLLEATCWDKDRFGKDYLGEFDVALEDIFGNGQITQEPCWYTLKSKRKGAKKKGSYISGEIQLQFTILDPSNQSATPQDILQKFMRLIASSPEDDEEGYCEAAFATVETRDEDDEDEDDDTSDETGDITKPEVVEKRKKRLRLARLRRKTKARAYEFTGTGDVTGIAFLEIVKITDLPPERNVTRTSFDMDPFVVASLGRKTHRTRVKRHNLNPIYDEKMVFQVMRQEQSYSLSFTVIDRDKLSGNDFVGTATLPLSTITSRAPEADPETGLYVLREPPDSTAPPAPTKSRFRLPMSRSTSSTSLNKLSRPGLPTRSSQLSGSHLEQPAAPTSVPNDPNSLTNVPSHQLVTVPSHNGSEIGDEACHHPDDPDLRSYTLPIILKNKDKWKDKYQSQLYIKAKYLPYPALRQQFWRAMLKQYDADESARVSKVELTTMLDTLGSTLKDATIDAWFQRFSEENGAFEDLSFDQAVICLEDQLQRSSHKKSWGDTVKDYMASEQSPTFGQSEKHDEENDTPASTDGTNTPLNFQNDTSAVSTISLRHLATKGENGDVLEKDDLADERGEEHVIEIRECPLCHQPRLNKRSDADIITHIATCASQDWRKVNNIVMAGFVTSSQAQRKWYSKVITKISYGGYKLGANSANILVQDRITGQINEERMSVYVRLGIRLLYKGLKSREMEKKRIRKLLRSLSVKQGKKYDDPVSTRDIKTFVNFHQLDMSEVLLPVEEFKNFNEFFYRQLKPGARPCSAPNNPRIIVSPSDSRSVVFNRMDEATKVWVKGREFSVERLIGNTYPNDAKRYVNGALGVFRLAPQDYHRFHIPVDGIMDEPKLIQGEYYTVNPMAVRSALDVYGENIRVVVPIDSVAHGRVMVICVGAMMVGSTIITRKAGDRVGRAEELGYFKFGGSTLLLLFEPGAMKFDDDLTENSKAAVETLLRVGMSIGHHPEQPQFTPDMRKKDENVTNEERQEAKRRIEGSLAPQAPEPSSQA
ncbi:phosphatidylserine decarboxylase [Xylographa parallela]|nr:phosphatidylserine decarboxylase [Xylographa parallela]